MADEPSIRVLIVDDEEDLRLGVRLNFEMEGFEVSHAVDGLDALEKIRGGVRPDVVLLDVRMPRMDGWECLAHLKADPELQDIPVVMFTNAEDGNGRRNGFEPDRYLERPVGPVTLLVAVRELVGKPARPVGH